MQLRMYITLMAIILAMGCTIDDSSTPTGPQTAIPPSDFPLKCVYHGQSPMGWDTEDLEEVAQADMVILPSAWCLSPEASPVLEELTLRNPDLQMIGYLLVFAVSVIEADTVYLRRNMPFFLDYYYAVEDDWAFTTTGDTLMMWPGQIMLNPISNGEINRQLIDETVDLLEEYREHPGSFLDGVMHDYFMDSPFIGPYARPTVHGEIDLNGNGIIFENDAEEQALFIEWQIEYAREIRLRFGRDFIQIANGRLPQRNAELARLLNGIFYEVFPNLRWSLTDRDGLLTLLEQHAEGFLSKAKGRTWSLVTNEDGGSNNLFCLLASMLAGCFYTELHGTCLFTGWTIDIEAGFPIGPAIIEGSVDSVLTVRRQFTGGEVRMSFDPSGERRETLFTETE
ncbi:MAG: hypothetical protein JSV33_04820 [bacterium]|nr:MAG: hypothetical protein JSV33_04820 [bacterium]